MIVIVFLMNVALKEFANRFVTRTPNVDQIKFAIIEYAKSVAAAMHRANRNRLALKVNVKIHVMDM